MKLLLSLILALTIPASLLLGQELVTPVPGATRTATIQVRVAPDRAGWTYAVGEPVKFRIDITADNESLTGTLVRYSIGPEMLPAPEHTTKLPAGGLILDGGTMKEPGFLRCLVTATVGGKDYRGSATAGFSPEKIQPTQTEPGDFTKFWDDQKSLLSKIPLEAQMTLQPDLCTPAVDTYHVSFQNVGGNTAPISRIYGMLCVPKGPGPFPAVLRVPGAGVRGYTGSQLQAARGVITLDIGINGIPVNLPAELYTALGSGALNGYNVSQLDDRERYYYRRVYLGCVRANDFLCSLPKFDGNNLGVSGGSQGGLLAIVTAALDPRVKVLACSYPALSDVTGYLHGRAGGWPGLTKPEKDNRPSRHSTPDKIATTGYYDAVNFARHLQAPGIYSWGYNDDICPPTSTFSSYNVIVAPKQLLLTPELGHVTIPEQNEIIQRWLLDRLGAKSD